MARLAYDDYLRRIKDESARFRAVLADCDPTARVPSCPDWDAADLLWHLGEVQHFWATMLRQRPVGPDDYSHADRPETYAGLLEYFDQGSAQLVAELDGVDPAAETWTWSQDHTAGFIYRRQAHEALIHRLDAEQTADAVTDLDAELAADGVDEALDVMFGGTPDWGTFTGGGRYVRVDITDRGESVWVETGHFAGTDPDDGKTYDEGDISKVDPRDSDPDAVVTGTAAALDAWLWRRGDDAGIAITGDDDVVTHFRACVDQAIN